MQWVASTTVQVCSERTVSPFHCKGLNHTAGLPSCEACGAKRAGDPSSHKQIKRRRTQYMHAIHAAVSSQASGHADRLAEKPTGQLSRVVQTNDSAPVGLMRLVHNLRTASESGELTRRAWRPDRLATHMARGPQRRKALAANLAARKQLNSCMPVPTTHLTACPRLTGRGAGLASKTLQQARACQKR